jgi:hypothetical protein
MGGFLFMEKRDDPDEKGAIASPYEGPLTTLIQTGKTRVTEKRIKDKSKGDIISKGIVIFQTLWFILQFAARFHQKLRITELELVTFSYTVLNLAAYFFWWNKPQNVECPIRVYAEDLPLEDLRTPSSSLAESPSLLSAHQSSEVESDATASNTPGGPRIDTPFLESKTPGFNNLGSETIERRKDFWSIWERMGCFLGFVMIGSHNSDLDSGFFTESILWYTGRSTRPQSFIIFTVSATLACIFGGIHLVAWNFGFPTSTGQLIWRTMAVIITAVPVCGLAEALLFQATDTTVDYLDDDFTIEGIFLFYLQMLLLFVYAVARIILLVQVFVLLRGVSPEIYQTVAWTNYIPHF